MTGRIKRSAALLAAAGAVALAPAGCTSARVPSVTRTEVRAEKYMAAVDSWKVYRKRFGRVNDVAFRLLRAASEITEDRDWSYGIVFDSLDNYKKKERNTAMVAFQELTYRVSVSHVIKSGPAEGLGLEVGDMLEEYNGQRIISFKDLERAFEFLGSGEYPGPGRFVFSRGERLFEVFIKPEQIAPYGVRLGTDSIIGAFADGKNIYVTYGMLRICEDDDDLAVVLGHEVAHNLENHLSKRKLKTAAAALPFALLGAAAVLYGGVEGSPLVEGAAVVAGAKFSRDHEREADYVGAYLLARAGFNVDSAASFWRRFASEVPREQKESYLRTHPTDPERAARLRKAVDEIIDKKMLGLKLLPERR